MLDFNLLASLPSDTSLRPYQQTQKENIYKFFESCKSVMLQMPTGTGKTRLFTSIAKDIHKYSVRTHTVHRVLILAHRIELIEQISESVGQKYNLAHGLIIPNSNYFILVIVECYSNIQIKHNFSD
jgi:superfamily II DNA or RNA helicase